MTRRAPLPPHLAEGPFTTRDALIAGVSRGRLDAADLSTPFRGLRVPPGFDPADLRQLCAAILPRLRPGEHFSHITALRLWGAPVRPLPYSFAEGEPEILHVSVPPPHRATRLRGIAAHQISDSRVRVLWHEGLPRCDPASAWLQSAQFLEPRELLVAGDALCLSPRGPQACAGPLLSTEELRERCRGSSRRGSRRARATAELVRDGAESRMETLLRYALVSAGLAEPVVQFAVRSPRGDFVGRFDLAYPERRVLIEYDGEQHRTDRRRYRLDIRRLDAARSLGYRVVRVLAEDLRDSPRSVVARVLTALAEHRSEGPSPGAERSR